MVVNIEGLNKAKVLKALYDASHVQGYGFLNVTANFTVEDAQKILNEGVTYFDYLYGRVMKVDLSSDVEFDSRLYDRDNYDGAAQAVIEQLRNELNINKEENK